MVKQTTEQVKQSLDAVLGGNVPQSQLDAWKIKYEFVHIVKVVIDENKTVTGYYKKPKRDIIANCVNMATEGKVFEAREFLANNTFLGGDAELQTNEDVAIAAQINLWKSLNFLKAEVVKF